MVSSFWFFCIMMYDDIGTGDGSGGAGGKRARIVGYLVVCGVGVGATLQTSEFFFLLPFTLWITGSCSSAFWFGGLSAGVWRSFVVVVCRASRTARVC